MKRRAFTFLLALTLTATIFALVLSASARAAGTLPFAELTFDRFSGVGAWSETLTLKADGTFSGKGNDEDFDGVTVWEYEGAFTDIQRVGEGLWRFTCGRVASTVPAGETREDPVMGTVSYIDPPAPTQGQDWYLYAPGAVPGDTDWAEAVRQSYGQERLDGSFILVPSKDQEALPFAASPADSAAVLEKFDSRPVKLDGGNIYLNGSGTVLDADSYIEAAGVPAETDGVPVTAVGDRAFADCRQLEDVTLPEGLVSVGEGAFSGCAALRSVSLPRSLETLGKDAFSGCAALTQIDFAGTETAFRKLAAGSGIDLARVTVTYGTPEFSDVPEGHWSRKYVDEVASDGAMEGVGGGLFAPDEEVDWGMALTTVARLSGVETEIEGGEWYDAGMKWGEELKLTGGKKHDTVIQRQELAYILWTANGQLEVRPDVLSGFSDVSQVGSRYLRAMEWAVSEHILEGDGAGHLIPDRPLTRAMLAAVLTRAF